jgi:hypothetical protein
MWQLHRGSPAQNISSEIIAFKNPLLKTTADTNVWKVWNCVQNLTSGVKISYCVGFWVEMGLRPPPTD